MLKCGGLLGAVRRFWGGKKELFLYLFILIIVVL